MIAIVQRILHWFLRTEEKNSIKIIQLYNDMEKKIEEWNYDFSDIVSIVQDIKTKKHKSGVENILAIIRWYDKKDFDSINVYDVIAKNMFELNIRVKKRMENEMIEYYNNLDKPS